MDRPCFTVALLPLGSGPANWTWSNFLQTFRSLPIGVSNWETRIQRYCGYVQTELDDVQTDARIRMKFTCINQTVRMTKLGLFEYYGDWGDNYLLINRTWYFKSVHVNLICSCLLVLHQADKQYNSTKCVSEQTKLLKPLNMLVKLITLIKYCFISWIFL